MPNISSDAEHENWFDHHSALCHDSNSCHLAIMYHQPTVPPRKPTEYLILSDYTGTTINITHVRIFLSACWQLFPLPPAQAKRRNLVTIYQTNGLSYRRVYITFFPNIRLRRDGAKCVRLIWTEIYVQVRASVGVNFPLSRNNGICISWPFHYVPNY